MRIKREAYSTLICHVSVVKLLTSTQWIHTLSPIKVETLMFTQKYIRPAYNDIWKNSSTVRNMTKETCRKNKIKMTLSNDKR